MTNCPKCDADLSGTYEAADPSVGIMCSGWFCDDCDLFVELEDDQDYD